MPASRIYPDWDDLDKLKNPLTAGEKALLKYLDTYLPKDPKWKKGDPLKNYEGWIIFAQPFLNGSRPDVVAYHPFVGMIIYEVKDWDLRHYSWGNDQDNEKVLFVSDAKGRYPVKNPVNQVNHYKEKILGQLVPLVGEHVDKEKKGYGLVKTGLYFHNANTDSARELIGLKKYEYKYFPVIGHDYLTEEQLSEIVPDTRYSESKFWETKWNDELLFWLIPPFHSIEQGRPLTLRGNQKKIAEPTPGHHRVRGVAGSGKTQALAYRAGKLASMGMDILVITFNITLWHYVKDMIQRAPFPFEWGRITFNHFHGFCGDKLTEAGADWPESPQRKLFRTAREFEEALNYFFKVIVPDAVRSAIEVNTTHYDKYDAILIDEGQDYEYEWYALLDEYFLKSRDELLVVCDKNQNIYRRELTWLDKRITRDGLEKFKDPYIDLQISFRMPDKVALLSNEFAEKFILNQELKPQKSDANPVLIHSQHVIWLNIEDSSWLENIDAQFEQLKADEYSPSDTVILLPNHKVGMMCVHHFEEKGIEVNHIFEESPDAYKRHKRTFYMGDSRLKMSTVHSFKGWELANIILFISEDTPSTTEDLDSVIYTAITRTRENLIVLNAHPRYTEFGRRYPKRWNEQ